MPNGDRCHDNRLPETTPGNRELHPGERQRVLSPGWRDSWFPHCWNFGWELSPALRGACERHQAFLREEVLAEEVGVSVPTGNGVAVEEWSFDGERARVGITRVSKGG
jgi:hypothetical protein